MPHFYLPGILIRCCAKDMLSKQVSEFAYFYGGRLRAVCAFYATRSLHFNQKRDSVWPGASWLILTRKRCRIHCTALHRAWDIERTFSHVDPIRFFTASDKDCPVQLRLGLFPILCHSAFPNTWLGILCLGGVSYCCIEAGGELFVYFVSRSSIRLLFCALREWMVEYR